MKWFENKTWLWVCLGILLLFFVLMVGFHFFRKEEVKQPEIEKDPVVLPGEDEMEFVNQSSLSVEEVWNLVNTKKEALRKLFYESEVYVPSEIDSKYTSSDDERYVVFGSVFLKTLHDLVTDSIYTSILNEMTMIKEGYYLAGQDIFEEIYLDSAIADIDITTSSIQLISANDDYINASVKLSICEDDETCEDSVSVPFELQNVNHTWKISAFQLSEVAD